MMKSIHISSDVAWIVNRSNFDALLDMLFENFDSTNPDLYPIYQEVVGGSIRYVSDLDELSPELFKVFIEIVDDLLADMRVETGFRPFGGSNMSFIYLVDFLRAQL